MEKAIIISPFCGATDTPVLGFWWQGHLHTTDSSDSPVVQHLLTSWRPWRSRHFDTRPCEQTLAGLESKIEPTAASQLHLWHYTLQRIFTDKNWSGTCNQYGGGHRCRFHSECPPGSWLAPISRIADHPPCNVSTLIENIVWEARSSRLNRFVAPLQGESCRR